MDVKRERLRRWAGIAGLPEEAVSSPSDLTAYFQRFRPDGQGVDSVFEGQVGGAEVLQRLLECYRASADSYTPADAYFIVRRQPPESASVTETARKHLAAMAQIARAMGEAELETTLTGVTPVLVDGATPEDSAPPDDDAPEVWLYDVVFDYMSSLRPLESDVLLLDEAFYSIANDLCLKSHLMWPLYAEASDLDEPFRPYFELWCQGVWILFRRKDSCLLLAT